MAAGRFSLSLIFPCQRERVGLRGGTASPNGNSARLEKLHETLRVRAIPKEEIDALVRLLDVDALVVCPLLQNRLLQEHECSLVVDVLPDLHAPRAVCVPHEAHAS